jgi:Ca-activated chloride channel family protein
LVNQLRSVDKVAIVVYAGSAGLVLPSTSGDEKTKILNAIDNLEAGGSTAGGQGIILAYRIAKENLLKDGNNRVILATDGDFNVGASSDADMERLIEEKRKDGIYLSVLGFGMGNYKDSKMEKLADKGNGNYAYIDNILEAKKVFVGQLAGTLYTIAKDVKLQVEFNPAKVKAYRLIGYENRLLKKEDFNNDKKDAGDMGAGHSVTAFYEIVPVGIDIDLPKVDSLRYQRPPSRASSSQTDELLTIKIRYKPPKDTVSILQETPVLSKVSSLDKTSGDFQFATAVVQFCMILRESKFLGNTNYDNVLESAQAVKGEDKEGYRSEFIQLVDMCKSLPKRTTNK